MSLMKEKNLSFPAVWLKEQKQNFQFDLVVSSNVKNTHIGSLTCRFTVLEFSE